MQSHPIATAVSLINGFNDRIYEVKPVRAHYYYKTFKKMFCDYMKQHLGKDDIPLYEIDNGTIEGFALYLNGQNISDRSRTVYNRILRQALFSINEKGKLTADMLVRRHSTNTDYMNAEELLSLVQARLPSDRLMKVRDVFLFMCFTGLRHDDVLELTADRLAIGEGERARLRMENADTGQQVEIPLLAIPWRIIRKYAERPGVVLLPHTSSTTTNQYLKEVQQLCGIEKHLTLCVARNTFAATVAGETLMSPAVITWLLEAKFHNSTFPTLPLDMEQMERDFKKTGRKLAYMNKHLIL